MGNDLPIRVCCTERMVGPSRIIAKVAHGSNAAKFGCGNVGVVLPSYHVSDGGILLPDGVRVEPKVRGPLGWKVAHMLCLSEILLRCLELYNKIDLIQMPKE